MIKVVSNNKGYNPMRMQKSFKNERKKRIFYCEIPSLKLFYHGKP
jgi:hypothetical protein